MFQDEIITTLLTLTALIREAIMIRLTLITSPASNPRLTRTLACYDITAIV